VHTGTPTSTQPERAQAQTRTRAQTPTIALRRVPLYKVRTACACAATKIIPVHTQAHATQARAARARTGDGRVMAPQGFPAEVVHRPQPDHGLGAAGQNVVVVVCHRRDPTCMPSAAHCTPRWGVHLVFSAKAKQPSREGAVAAVSSGRPPSAISSQQWMLAGSRGRGPASGCTWYGHTLQSRDQKRRQGRPWSAPRKPSAERRAHRGPVPHPTRPRHGHMGRGRARFCCEHAYGDQKGGCAPACPGRVAMRLRLPSVWLQSRSTEPSADTTLPSSSCRQAVPGKPTPSSTCAAGRPKWRHEPKAPAPYSTCTCTAAQSGGMSRRLRSRASGSARTRTVLPPRLLALHGSRARVRHQAWATEAQGGAYADHGKSTARERTR